MTQSKVIGLLSSSHKKEKKKKQNKTKKLLELCCATAFLHPFNQIAVVCFTRNVNTGNGKYLLSCGKDSLTLQDP